MWNMYADLFKGNINLSINFFLGGWEDHFCVCFFNCFWQNHYDAGVCWEWDGVRADKPILKQ